MVILVIGSMIAFTGESLFTAAGENAPVLFGLLGCGIALVAGFQFGRPIPYAIGGAIVGAVMGAFLPAFAGGGISTGLGTFDDKRMQGLRSNRNIANSFVANCQSLAYDTDRVSMNTFNIISPDDSDLFLGEAMRAEAEEMGIYVDDAAVNQFIKEYTGGKLTSDEFLEAKANLQTADGGGVSEDELYDILRGEIQAVLARNMLMPRRFGQAGTPEMYWDMYQRLNVNQEMAFTGLNVDSFLSEVEEPGEAELKALYEQYKNKPPGQEPGVPGFYQGRQLKLAYLEIDYTSVSDAVAEITEEDITKYYEDNKEALYKETLPADPTGPGAKENDSEFDLDAFDSNKKEEEKPAEPGEPEAPTGPKEAPTENKEPPVEAPNKPPEGDDGCGFFQEEAGESTEQAESATPEKTTQEPPTTPTLTIPEVPDEDGDKPQDPAEMPATYKPLNDDLKKQIRNSLTRERAGNRLAELVEQCQNEMDRLQQLRVNRDLDKQLGEKTVEAMSDSQLLQELKAFAAKLDGVFYVETPIVGVQDFVSQEEYPIAFALPPGGRFTRAQNVLMRLFGTPGEVPMFATEVVEEFTTNFMIPGNRYVYWVVGEIPPHEPKDYDEVKDQVLKAWKQMKARPIAEERGKALAEKIKAGLADEKTMSEILKDETETGKPDSPALVVSESSVFRWMKSSSAASFSMQRQPPQLEQVQGVRGISDDFMEYVFRDVEPEGVGVTPNRDLSIYYVVHPLNRFPAEDSDVEATQNRFIRERHFEFNSPIPGMLDRQVGDTNLNWVRQIQKKYKLDVNEG